MKLTQTLFLLSAMFLFCMEVNAKNYQIESPDRKISLKVSVDQTVSWSVKMNGKQVIDDSSIALELEKETLGNSPRLLKSSVKEINEITQAVVPYKFRNIVDNCNELLLKFKGDFAVRFRAYNNGVAYRIEVDREEGVIVKNEVCELNFPQNTTVLFPEEKSFISHYERLYTDTILSAISSDQFCSLPALITTDEGIRAGITETGQSDYPGMFLKGTDSNSLKAIFPAFPLEIERIDLKNERIVKEAPYIARMESPAILPWRCLLLSENDLGLVENNIPYILSEKCVLEDTSWIKPGKVAWEWWSASNIYNVSFKSGINTETYKYYIDFASEYGIEYIVMDGGWSDYTRIGEPKPDIDINGIIDYGKKKNVGVILWVLWNSLLDDLDGYLDIYAKWGAAGIKVDFMQRADQLMVGYYEQIASATAKRKMIVDYHGAFKPNGLQRKYPNVVNFEGVLGGEWNKFNNKAIPEHNVTLPFTRMLAGPMDYTPGAMRNETGRGFHANFENPMSQGTRCHQAAMYVVYEAPLQMLCDNASHYLKEPGYTRFISQIPVVWDETIVLEGKVKEFIVLARRNADKWYIGGMTNWTARELEIELDFLGEGDWEIQYVSDGLNADRYPSDYVLGKEKLENKRLKIRMAPGGGYAAILRKCDK